MRVRCVVSIAVLILSSGAVAAPASAQIRWGEATTEQLMRARYDTHPGGQLRVEVRDADVVVRTGPQDTVVLEVFVTAHDMERARARFREMAFSANGNDDEVELVSNPPTRGWADWSWRRWGRFDVTVEATIPADYHVDVRTQDGDIAAERLQGRVRLRSADGDIAADRLAGEIEVSTSDGEIAVGEVVGSSVSLRSSDGDINVGSLRAAAIVIDTSDGDISGDRVEGDSIYSTTADGDIIFGAVSGPLQAHTSDGSIHISVERLDDTALRTGDGDITIRAPESLAASLDLQGRDLSLRSHVRFDGTLTRRVIRGALNGGGPTLQARTGDGTIVLHLTDR